jgi:transcription initiation factor IIE alpha subunit
MNPESVELYSWIIRGKQRTAVLCVLDKPMTPKQISEQTHIKFSNVSDVLRAMTEKGIAICLNPKQKTGRLYDLTKSGKKVKKEFS